MAQENTSLHTAKIGYHFGEAIRMLNSLLNLDPANPNHKFLRREIMTELNDLDMLIHQTLMTVQASTREVWQKNLATLRQTLKSAPPSITAPKRFSRFSGYY